MAELIAKIDEMIEFDKRQMLTASVAKRKALENHLNALEAFRDMFSAEGGTA